MIKDFDEALKVAKETKGHKLSKLLEMLPLSLRGQVAGHLIAANRYKDKIPTWIENNCEIELTAAEQASPEPVAHARFRKLTGRIAIDLTAGLGIDTFALSRRFEKVIAIERDNERSERLKRNLNRMDVTNVRVINTASELFLDKYKFEQIDFIYLDPDRRATGNKRSDWMAAEPRLDTLINMIPQSIPIWVKQSPAFHWRAGCTQFPQLSEIEASSWKNETKEVIWKFNQNQLKTTQINLTARNLTNNNIYEFSCTKNRISDHIKVKEIKKSINIKELKYIIIPANSIYSINIENEWIDSLGINYWSTGPHGWFLVDQKINNGLGKTYELISWNIGQLSELKNWLKKNNWKPKTVYKRGIQAKVEQIISKFNHDAGEGRDLWIGASGTGQYFLGVTL
jgi:hypothetical protein